jgi:hypothetical protein
MLNYRDPLPLETRKGCKNKNKNYLLCLCELNLVNKDIRFILYVEAVEHEVCVSWA